MKKLISIALIIVFLMGCILTVYAAEGVPKSVMDSTQSVVRILSEYSGSSATGSGFVIKNIPGEVLIATNDHVVEGRPKRISVWVTESKKTEAEIVFTSSERDLCVLRLKGTVDMKPLKLSTEQPEHGAAIYAVGFPGAGDILSDKAAHTSDSATITDGIISAIRNYTIEKGGRPVKLLQINAAINSGNSGGPLFNTKGEVIGINTYKVNAQSQGVFGAVAVSELLYMLEKNEIFIPPVISRPNITVLCAGIGLVIAVVLLVWKLRKRSVRKKNRNINQDAEKEITLREHLRRWPRGIGVGKAVSLLMPVAVELRNFHNDGKLHLEISPDTILLKGNAVRLKEPSGGNRRQTNSGYIAPEVHTGTGLGMVSDIYSFAAVLLFAATGHTPSNPLQKEQGEWDYDWITDEAFAACIRKAMAYNGSDRFPSMQELIFALMVFNTPAYVNQGKNTCENQTQNVRAVMSQADIQKLLSRGKTAPDLARQNATRQTKEREEQRLQSIVDSEKKIRDGKLSDTKQIDHSRTEPKRRKWLKPVLICMVLASLICGFVQRQYLLSETKYIWARILTETEHYEEAIKIYEELGDFKNSPQRLLENHYLQGHQYLANKQYANAAGAFQNAGSFKDSVKAGRYVSAEMAREKHAYYDAYLIYQSLGDYIDSVSKTREMKSQLKQMAEKAVQNKKFSEAAILYGCFGDSKTLNLSKKYWAGVAVRPTLDAGGQHIAAVNKDGSVVAVGKNTYGQCDTEEWTDVMAVSTGYSYTVALKTNGTVVAAGRNDYHQCDVDGWRDIVDIQAGLSDTFGLRTNGTLIMTGHDYYNQSEALQWSNIMAVAAGHYHVVGLKTDGSVVAAGSNKAGQCDVGKWTDIVSVAAGAKHTVGLKADGTVVAVGHNGYGCCNVAMWTDIVEIAAGDYFTVGLKSDGTVVATGNNNHGQCDVEKWSDIVAVCGNEHVTAGLRKNGKIVVTGYKGTGQFDVKKWKNTRFPYDRKAIIQEFIDE